MISDLIVQQATDVFRIGLLIALIATMLRTEATTGTLLPLAAGVVFVAVMIPLTTSAGALAPLWQQVATGIVVNAVYVAIGLGIWRLWQRRG
ncbi:hypothetical protein JJJ17_17700 [Paracoccus caeni]|uniref:Uncharacterized protein n=1 Tax=Paracoccus caeni TaxID=657651 RepID=A0A934VW84_9RHOB|nr:hypothetical protein [Paracoccus caeni]MBK4217771.1 hypothetical protein [Paracoccus caeni]